MCTNNQTCPLTSRFVTRQLVNMKTFSSPLATLSKWKLSKRRTLALLILVWLTVTVITYFGFIHVQSEHASLELVHNPLKSHAILTQNKHDDKRNFKSPGSGLLSIALMIRSTILVDPVSQFYQSVFPSLLAFWNENLSKELLLVLDADRWYTTYWMDDDARDTLAPILDVVFKKEELPPFWNKLYLTGYDRQQYSTLQADVHTEHDIIMMLDTDSPFIVMPLREDFIDDTTNRIKLVASNIWGGRGRQHDWSTSCELLFGRYLIDGMTMLPQVYHRSTLINFRRYFTEVMRREYYHFVEQYKVAHPEWPGIGKDVEFETDFQESHPINNTEMDRTILFALNDPESPQFGFADAFMFFAQNFSNKPYSEYTLLMNYAYTFEHDKYEWHIDNWNVEGENLPHHRITGHWKWAKPETEKYARVTCCHLYFDQLLDSEITKESDEEIYTFCDSVREDLPDLNGFYEDWFHNGQNFYSISPEFSDSCPTATCQSAQRWDRDDKRTQERYRKMRNILDAEAGVFSEESLKVKYENCWNITRLRMNQVYQYIRLRHKGKHGQLPKPPCHHRNAFKEISGGKY